MKRATLFLGKKRLTASAARFTGMATPTSGPCITVFKPTNSPRGVEHRPARVTGTQLETGGQPLLLPTCTPSRQGGKADERTQRQTASSSPRKTHGEN